MTSTASDPASTGRSTLRLVVAIVAVGSVTPLILYGALFGRIPTVTPDRAREMLGQSGDSTVVVDVRPTDVFERGHIDGAVNWPLHEVLAVEGAEQVRPDLREKTLLLICDSGMTSRVAARWLDRQGVDRVINVRGGIQEWFHSINTPERRDFDCWRTGPDTVGPFQQHQSPPWKQALAVLAFFIIKPVYTILALLFVVLLWRAEAPDLVALRWGLIFFFLGENACGVNYLVFKEQSYLLEYLHSLGMLLCFGFVAYAALEGFDRRILKLSAPSQRCAAIGLCRECIKYADVPCGLRQTFYMILPVAIILSMMLPLADWQDHTYGTTIFRAFYCYGHLRIFQQFENWYCPAAAVTLFAISLGILATRKGHDLTNAKITFAAGIGPLGFGMLRLMLGAAYDQNRVWYLFWEESTEFLFILGIGVVLWIFRRGLLADLKLPGEMAGLLDQSAHRAGEPPQAAQSS